MPGSHQRYTGRIVVDFCVYGVELISMQDDDFVTHGFFPPAGYTQLWLHTVRRFRFRSGAANPLAPRECRAGTISPEITYMCAEEVDPISYMLTYESTPARTAAPASATFPYVLLFDLGRRRMIIIIIIHIS